jgi:hypothetical protein
MALRQLKHSQLLPLIQRCKIEERELVILPVLAAVGWRQVQVLEIATVTSGLLKKYTYSMDTTLPEPSLLLDRIVTLGVTWGEGGGDSHRRGQIPIV